MSEAITKDLARTMGLMRVPLRLDYRAHTVVLCQQRVGQGMQVVIEVGGLAVASVQLEASCRPVIHRTTMYLGSNWVDLSEHELELVRAWVAGFHGEKA